MSTRILQERQMNRLETEWQSLPKNWYEVYQWQRSSCRGYTEWISAKIVSSIAEITLSTDGLRERSFCIASHRGQIKLRTDIAQITEKRLLRAMFNQSDIPLLGKVIDYEVPLKNKKEARHGDIDLLCLLKNQCFCIEAKKPNSNESLLKAVLQCYAYTSLAAKRKDVFLESFGLGSEIQLVPAVLTFASAASGKQLNRMVDYPNLLELVTVLNNRLRENGIQPIRFFVIGNLAADLLHCLATVEENNDVKAVFRDDFHLSVTEATLPSIPLHPQP